MTGIAKIVRQVNVLCASYALLVCIGVASGCRWAGSPPPRPHPPITFLELAVGALVLCWFAGAVALFYCKRLAWVASLVCAGALACAFADIGTRMLSSVRALPEIGDVDAEATIEGERSLHVADDD